MARQPFCGSSRNPVGEIAPAIRLNPPVFLGRDGLSAASEIGSDFRMPKTHSLRDAYRYPGFVPAIEFTHRIP